MNNIYFIDSNTPDIQTLIVGLPADATIVILQDDKNGLEQIAAYLQTNHVKDLDAIHLLDAIHVFADGSAGQLNLGNEIVNTETLNQNANLLAQIGQSLSVTGDILLYGCNVAQGETGQTFVETFATLTNADVAASDDLTGTAALGGDWDLEVQKGVIDAAAIKNLQYNSILKMNGTIASITPDTGTAADFITNATTLTFAGISSGPAGTVTLYDGSTSVGDFIFTANGPSAPWSIVTSNLTEGSHTFTLKQSTTLFATKTVVIDTTAPTLTSLNFQSSDATSSVFRATFDAAITGIDTTDFTTSGSTATVSAVNLVSAGVYDVTVSGGNFASYSGNQSLGFTDSPMITDVAGNIFVKPETTATTVVSNAPTPEPTPAPIPEPTPAPNNLPVFSSSVVTLSLADTKDNDSFAGATGTFTATDADSDTLTFGIVGSSVANGVSSSTNSYGTLAVTASSGEYVFTPNATAINALTANTTTTFSIVANDGKVDSEPQTFTVNLTGANDQPVLSSGSMVAGTFNATAPTGIVGTLVSSLISSSNVTDHDSGAVYGLAITNTVNTHGTWFYSTNNGTDWTAVGEVSASSALLLAADANTRVYFQPNNNFIGSTNLTIKAWDQTSGTVATKVDTSSADAFSAASKNVGVTIEAPPQETTATVLDVNFNNSTTIATVAPEAVTSAPTAYTTSVIIRAQNDTINSSNTMSPYQRFGSSTVTKPFGSVGNFLVLGDNTGQITGSPDNNGTFGFALPFTLSANTASITISFDWVFSAFGTPTTTADQFVVGVMGSGYNVTSPLTVTKAVIDQANMGNAKYSGTSATTYTLTTAELGEADANGKYWLSFGLNESSTATPDSAVGIDNIKVIATEIAANNISSPVTLTSFSTITGGNEDTEQTITFADLIAAGDEASTAGEVNAFVIKAVSTGTLKIGATLETATAWVKDSNDVVDASHNVYWTPAADTNGTLNAFTALAKEIGGQTSVSPKLVTVSIIGTNDAPVLNAAKSPSFTGDYSGAAPSGAVGALVSSLVDFATPAGQVDNVTDVDASAALGVAITATDNTHGTWYYSTNAGSTWKAVGEVSATSALLLAADANTRVYFQAANGFVGVSNFTIKAWDQTSGIADTKADTSTGSAFSIATDNVEVKPAGNYAVYADTTAMDTFTPSASSFVEGQLKKLTSTLTGFVNPTVNSDSSMEWTGDGTTTLYSYEGVNYVLSLAGKYGTLYAQKGVDVNSSAKVPYVYVADDAKVNALPANVGDVDKFTVAGTHRPNGMTGTTYYDTLDVYVSGANDAPTLTGQKAVLDSTFGIADLLQGYSDVDTGDELSVANLMATNGMLVNNHNGTWTFTPETGFSGDATLSYDVQDKLGVSISVTQTLNVIAPLSAPISLLANMKGVLVNTPFEYGSAKFSPDSGFTYSANSLPEWLTMDAQTGVLSGTPMIADLATQTIQIGRNGEMDSLTLMVSPFKTGHLHTVEETGNAGLDTVTYYNAPSSVTATIANTTENIVGSGFNDNLTGNTKANVLDGGAGADTLVGSTGSDTYVVDNSGDVIVENANEGTDSVLSLVDYTLPANVEKLTLLGSTNLSATGNALNNLVTGNAGNNTLAGGGGVDTLKGGLGDDVYIVNSETVSVIENAKQGIDTVNATVSFILPRNVENLTLFSSSNLDGIGNTLNNVLQGNSGNNILIGGSGKDMLIGGGGNDTLDGGTGIDTAIFGSTFSAYQFTRSTDSDGNTYIQVASQTEIDRLYSIEFLQFSGDEVARNLSSISIIGS